MIDQGMISMFGHHVALAIGPVEPLHGSVEKVKAKILGLIVLNFL